MRFGVADGDASGHVVGKQSVAEQLPGALNLGDVTTIVVSVEIAESARKRGIPDEELLEEIESANQGDGPDPIASFEGNALREILAAVADRTAAQARVDTAVAHARAQGASWTAIGAMLGISRQAALKRYSRAA